MYGLIWSWWRENCGSGAGSWCCGDGDFPLALDQRRRERITEAENLKAQRNKLTEVEVTRLRLKKGVRGQDAGAVMDETRALKSRMDELEVLATESSEEQLRAILTRIPNLMPR